MSTLRVTAQVLSDVSAEFRSAADELRTGLSSLDADVAGLAGSEWSGGAASAFSAVWREWHEGASDVLKGLETMSGLLIEAAGRYTQTDESSADKLSGA